MKNENVIIRTAMENVLDLGVIEVPSDYDPLSWLKTFREKHRQKFCGRYSIYKDEEIHDECFNHPSFRLEVGMRLSVRSFPMYYKFSTGWHRMLPGSDEIKTFLKSQDAVFVGMQGLSLLFDQKHDSLPKGEAFEIGLGGLPFYSRGIWYLSYDEDEKLPESGSGRKGLPCLTVNTEEYSLFTRGSCDVAEADALCFNVIN